MKQERVLAYRLAQTLDEHELAEVAGGEVSTGKTTVRPSGSPGSWDMSWDVSLDW